MQSPEFIMTRGLWQQTKQIFASFRRDVYHQGCDTFLLPGPGLWKVSYEHSQGLFNCGLIVLRKEERVESL